MRTSISNRPKRTITAMVTAAFAAAAVLLGASSFAAPPDPFADDVTAIRARHIITVNSGVIENGIVLVRNGKIVGLGSDVKIPVGAKILTADTVMPGIVGISSQIGLSAAAAGPAILPGPGGLQGGGGAGAGARAAANPHFRVVDELYPFEDVWSKLIREGVTTLTLIPPGTGISGQGSVIRPTGDSTQAMILAANSVLGVHFAANSQTMDLIRSTFEGVRPQPVDPTADPMSDFLPDGAPRPDASTAALQVRRGQGRPAGGAGRPAGPATGNQAARQEPVLKAFNGAIPTMISCPDNASVAYALPLFASFEKLKPIYVLTAADSNRVAAMVGAKSLDVVLPAAIMTEPLTTNRVNVVAQFVDAGAKVACRPAADDVEGYHTLRFQMGQLVKAGMDMDMALRAITLAPAEMLGLAGRVGSVAVGRDANLLLLDGAPFEPGTRVRKVLLEGKVAYDGE